MIDFEKIEQRERHPSIELSDEVIRSRLRLTTLICEPPKIMQKIEAPILEKQIKEKGMHPKKNKRKKCNE